MNRALSLRNWSDKGNNYVLKATAKNKWSGFQQSVIEGLISKFSDDFNIVIWTDEKEEDDYYCIPFSLVKHVFVEEHKTTGKYPDRWTAVIIDHKFLMHSNSQIAVDISTCYAKRLVPLSLVQLDDDFFIEDAKAEIKVRLKQSKFRKGVLKNFGYQCALSGIADMSLLMASHVVPWSRRKDFRGDISNGMCLYVEYDALFDKGFISFTDDLDTIVASNPEDFSQELRSRLQLIKGRKLRQPLNKPLNKDYLDYHRRNVFKG